MGTCKRGSLNYHDRIRQGPLRETEDRTVIFYRDGGWDSTEENPTLDLGLGFWAAPVLCGQDSMTLGRFSASEASISVFAKQSWRAVGRTESWV